MSPKCPICSRTLVGIRATAEGPQAQPCDCDLSETVVDELRSPFVDRGRGVVTDGGQDHCGAEGPAGLRCTRINGHDGAHTTYRKIGGDDHHIEWWECNPVGDPVEDKEIATDGGEDIPPARDGEINRIPDLREGDRVLVETMHDYAPDRKLTVESVGTDATSQGPLAFRPDDEGYTLTGYGTEYALYTVGTPHWRRVDIECKSRDPQIVSDIEVLERAEREQPAVTDGGTIVGDPQADTRTIDTADCEEGDQVAIHPEPLDESDCPEVIHGRVERAEVHTTNMAGDSRERVTGETLEIEATDGEVYHRKGTGVVSRKVEGTGRGGNLTTWRTIASDSDLERVSGDLDG